MKCRRVAIGLLALAAAPVEARKQCPQAQVDNVAAFFRQSAGNVGLLVAHVRQRFETDDVMCWAKQGETAMVLEFGKRFEAGDGVNRDVRRAGPA